MFTDDEIKRELEREVALRIAVYRKKEGGRLGSVSMRRIALMKAAANRFGATYTDPWADPPDTRSPTTETL